MFGLLKTRFIISNVYNEDRLQSGFYAHLFVVLLILISAAFRLVDLGSTGMVTDERLWVKRSAKLVQNLKDNPTHFSDHLGHPGVPPAILMGVGQVVVGKIDRLLGRTGNEAVSRLVASRLPLAILASLLAPLVYYGFRAIVGVQVALLAAFFVAVDPQLIGIARMAHLDSTLTLFVVASVAAFLSGTIRSNTFLIVLAGVFWGLAIATKPTAVFLIPGFLVLRILLAVGGGWWRALFRWSDLAALFVGLSVFSALCTRLWEHRGAYFLHLGIRNALARELFRIGIWLQQHGAVTIAVLAVALTTALFLSFRWRDNQQDYRWHIAAAVLVVSVVLFTLTLFPQVYENQVRFWTWVFRLRRTQAGSFITHLEVPQPFLGYFQLLVSLMPLFASIGICSAFALLVLRFRKSAAEELALLALLIVAVIWFVGLGVSGKKVWRYILPVVPLLYLGVAWFILEIRNRLETGVQIRQVKSLVVVLLIAVAIDTALWHPNYFTSRSVADRVVSSVTGYQLPEPSIATPEEIRFLAERADISPTPITVKVFGDAEIQKAVLAVHGGRERNRIVLLGDSEPTQTDYVISYPEAERGEKWRQWQQFIDPVPVYRGVQRRVVLVSVYRTVSGVSR